MDATEIYSLTELAVAELLAGPDIEDAQPAANGKRRTPRWPFPGTVQMWVPNQEGVEQHFLGTCINLSLQGLGMLCDEQLPVGLELAIAVHQPEASLQGRGIIRHCTRNESGYYIGLEFLFDPM